MLDFLPVTACEESLALLKWTWLCIVACNHKLSKGICFCNHSHVLLGVPYFLAVTTSTCFLFCDHTCPIVKCHQRRRQLPISSKSGHKDPSHLTTAHTLSAWSCLPDEDKLQGRAVFSHGLALLTKCSHRMQHAENNARLIIALSCVLNVVHARQPVSFNFGYCYILTLGSKYQYGLSLLEKLLIM